MGFIGQSFSYIGENIFAIAIVVIGLTLMTGYVLRKGTAPARTHRTLQKVAILENMATQGTFNQTLRAGFCRSTLGDSDERNRNCGLLNKKQCSLASCCGWARRKGASSFLCVAGDATGVTYNPNQIDEYYYLGKLVRR